MNTGEWAALFLGQAVISAAVGAILYHRLRLKIRRPGGPSSAPETPPPPPPPAAETSPFGPDFHRLRFVLNTLPKVGSNSIQASLKHALPESTLRCFHGITLQTQRALSQVIEQTSNEWARNTTSSHVFGMMAVRAELERCWKDYPDDTGLYFICGTREPVSWALSTLFQLQDVGILPDSVLVPSEARRLIMEWMQGRPPCAFFPRPEDWFQIEVAGYLGVDPMTAAFDTTRGFQIYPSRKGPLLIIRNESLDHLPRALAELLAVPQDVFQFQSARANVTEGKSQGSLYREVAATLRFPAPFIDELYARPYSVTFYSAAERKALSAKWTER